MSQTRLILPKATSHQVGKKIGRCLLTRVLGEGGGGVVYQALHQGLGIPVAVKVLRDEAKSPGVRAALKAEARLLAQLSHPNIVRVLDFDDEAEDPYLVLEYVEGFSLADLIAQCGWLRPEHAAGLIVQAAVGLAAAVRVGVIHRDVKPANILMTKDGQVKIADLGLAACSNSRLVAESGAADASLGGYGGTVAYMAPERFAAGAPTDARSDIYSLGVTFFEAITGRLPFDGSTAMEMMFEHVQSPFPIVRAAAPAISEAGAALIATMCEKEPAARFQTYDELIAALCSTFQLVPEHVAAVTWNSGKWQSVSRVESASGTGRHALTER